MEAEKDSNYQQIEKEIDKHDSMNWFVVRTKPRHEKKVAEQLVNLGYTVYLPLLTSIRMWSDRKKKIQTPLIPSVLFVENPAANKEKMYSIPGFSSILKLNGKIACVKPYEIEQLKIVVGEEMTLESVDVQKFVPGDEIEIVSGPLRGFFGKAIEDLTSYRVLIEISTLGIGYTVNVAKNLVQKVTKLH
ncbi:MAG: UpxY family transcription antiterminator [Crocinitomicaceae bacterium]|nr:UpxY family transcription antiterminator [Crocinitomicaceae bacterium]